MNAIVGIASPAQVLWLGLFTRNPGLEGDQSSEVNYGSYVRQPALFQLPTGIPDSLERTMLNNTMTFPRITSALMGNLDTFEIRFFGIMTSQALGSGDMLVTGEFINPLILQINDSPTLLAGDIALRVSGTFGMTIMDDILNHIRGQALPSRGNLQVGLFDGDPRINGTELSGGGYFKQNITMSDRLGATPWGDPPGTEIANIALVDFRFPQGNWGIWSHTALYSGTTIVDVAPRGISRLLNQQINPRIPPGGYKMRFI